MNCVRPEEHLGWGNTRWGARSSLDGAFFDGAGGRAAGCLGSQKRGDPGHRDGDQGLVG
jgi:hypothetical protein